MAKERRTLSLDAETGDRLREIAEYTHKTMAAVIADWVWSTQLPEDGNHPPGQQKLRLKK